jgi:hypothetical protein
MRSITMTENRDRLQCDVTCKTQIVAPKSLLNREKSSTLSKAMSTHLAEIARLVPAQSISVDLIREVYPEG